jgi:hypothetical protein
MPIPSRLSRLCLGALAVAGLSLATFAAGPAPAAHAQANFRVCVAWNSAATSGGIGTGLITKVYKNGDETCARKVEYMENYYGEAYAGSSAKHFAYMITCEQFAERIGIDGDPCYGLVQNAIYKFTSSADQRYPADNPSFSYWRP